MKGFGIYVKNNLLEPKHYQTMGEALWLYLWLLDKMTSVNEHGMGKVLSGRPITYEDVNEDLGVSRQVYLRWIKKLRGAGYINTLRTPKGLVFTVNKAEKIFGKRSINNNTSSSVKKVKKGSIKNDTMKADDVSKVIPPMYQKRNITAIKNDTSNIRQYTNNTINNTDDDKSSSEPAKPARMGNSDINEIFDFWAQECGYNIETQVKANRFAASNLLKKHGKEKLMQLIKGVALAHNDRYAPSISDFRALQAKLNDLILWGKKRQNEGSGNMEIIS